MTRSIWNSWGATVGSGRVQLVIGALAIGLASKSAPARELHHYVFFELDRERIHEPWFADRTTFAGAQLKYTWKELEPAKDRYEFGSLSVDLAFLESKGKKLFIQLQDVSFETNRVLVPDYLRREPAFHGGADLQYAFDNDEETHATPEGWVARRWDPAVRAQFQRLLAALGRRFDGRIEGINLPETAVGFGEKTNRHPAGFTFALYRDAILANMQAAKAAFPKSVVIQYANFMPGEWLPGNDHGYLKSVYAFAIANRVGVGGPDLLPFRPGQLNHSYPLIKSAAGRAPTAIAVQWGNYEALDPVSRRPISVPALCAFAHDELSVDYLFWSLQEPYFTRDVIPFVKSNAQRP